MKQIWKTKIDEIDEMILNTSIYKDGRVQQLMKKKYFLLKAFNRMGK